MKKAIIALSLLISNSAFADNIHTNMTLLSENKGFSLSGYRAESYHYCHMRTVYIALSGLSSNSLSMVWDHEKKQPLKCSDYHSYVHNLSLSKKDRANSTKNH